MKIVSKRATFILALLVGVPLGVSAQNGNGGATDAVSRRSAGAAPNGRILGRVLDAMSAKPLSGAQVYVNDGVVGALTDLDGRFVIGGVPLGTVTVDIYGLWTFVSERPLADGRHEIGLRVKRQGSEVSDPVLVTETGPAVPGVPEAPAELADAASSEASDATLPASEQLAAAEPGAAVQSDETSPSSRKSSAI